MDARTSTTGTETCPICGGVACLTWENRSVAIAGRSVIVAEEFWRCRGCGEEYLTPLQMRASQERATRRIRRDEGLLQSEEIRDFRTELGLTQQALETLLGVGPKTVVRWERGTVFQSRAVDTLIRVLRAHPGAVRQLADERGVAVAGVLTDPSVP